MEFSKNQELVTMSWEEFCEKIKSAYTEGHGDGADYANHWLEEDEFQEDWKCSNTYNQTLLREKDVSKYE